MCLPEISEVVDQDPESWLTALPAWQAEDVNQLRLAGESLDDVIDRLLRVNTAADTVPFGGEPGFQLFKHNVMREIYLFLCSSSKYQTERAEWVKQANVGKSSAVGFMSATFADLLGSASPYISAVIAVTLVSAGSIGLNAFCNTFAERYGSDSTG